MNEEFKFEKGSFIYIKKGGQLEVSSLKQGGWRYVRSIISLNGTLINYVPRDGRNFEQLAANRYYLFFKDN